MKPSNKPSKKAIAGGSIGLIVTGVLGVLTALGITLPEGLSEPLTALLTGIAMFAAFYMKKN